MPTQTSQLITNLSTIYNTKLQIKSVLGTNSDDFTQYPSLIQAAISEGGGGSDTEVIVDPWFNSYGVDVMIENEKTTADYVNSSIYENFTVTLDGNEENVEAVEWDFYVDVPTGELDQDDNTIYEQKAVHVIVSSNDEHGELPMAIHIEDALEHYPDLYGDFIYPILENATLTASEDPSEDGYDYLLEGDLYVWNLNNNEGNVMEVTENGFYPNEGSLGYDVNVPSGYEDNGETVVIFKDTDGNGTPDIELPYDDDTFPSEVEVCIYQELIDPGQDFGANKIQLNAVSMVNGYMTQNSADLESYCVFGANLDAPDSTKTGLTHFYIDELTLQTEEAMADGVAFRPTFYMNWNTVNEDYDDEITEFEINHLRVGSSNNTGILIPCPSGNEINVYLKWNYHNPVDEYATLTLYNGITGRELVADEDFTIVTFNS